MYLDLVLRRSDSLASSFPCVPGLCAIVVPVGQRSRHLVNGNDIQVAEPRNGSIV